MKKNFVVGLIVAILLLASSWTAEAGRIGKDKEFLEIKEGVLSYAVKNMGQPNAEGLLSSQKFADYLSKHSIKLTMGKIRDFPKGDHQVRFYYNSNPKKVWIIVYDVVYPGWETSPTVVLKKYKGIIKRK